MLENSIEDSEMGFDLNLKQTFDKEMQKPTMKNTILGPRPKKKNIYKNKPVVNIGHELK